MSINNLMVCDNCNNEGYMKECNKCGNQMDEMENNRYIVLYADDLDYDMWIDYCNILGVSAYSESIKIIVQDVVAYDNEESEVEQYDYNNRRKFSR